MFYRNPLRLNYLARFQYARSPKLPQSYFTTTGYFDFRKIQVGYLKHYNISKCVFHPVPFRLWVIATQHTHIRDIQRTHALTISPRRRSALHSVLGTSLTSAAFLFPVFFSPEIFNFFFLLSLPSSFYRHLLPVQSLLYLARQLRDERKRTRADESIRPACKT